MKKINISTTDKENLNFRVILSDSGEYRIKSDSDKFGGAMHISVENLQLNCFSFEGEYFDLKQAAEKFKLVYSQLTEEITKIKNLKFFDEGHSIHLKELFEGLKALQSSCDNQELFDFLIWDSMSGGFYVRTNKYLNVLTVLEVHNFLSHRNYSTSEIRAALQYGSLQKIYDNMQLD